MLRPLPRNSSAAARAGSIAGATRRPAVAAELARGVSVDTLMRSHTFGPNKQEQQGARARHMIHALRQLDSRSIVQGALFDLLFASGDRHLEHVLMKVRGKTDAQRGPSSSRLYPVPCLVLTPVRRTAAPSRSSTTHTPSSCLVTSLGTRQTRSSYQAPTSTRATCTASPSCTAAPCAASVRRPSRPRAPASTRSTGPPCPSITGAMCRAAASAKRCRPSCAPACERSRNRLCARSRTSSTCTRNQSASSG